MPPKKKTVAVNGKKKKTKGSSSRGTTIIDGISVVDMTKEQLEGHVVRLKLELEREREERNFFQLERDKLFTFWETSKKQAEEARAEIRNREHDLEELSTKQRAEIKVYDQKLKHVLFEHQNNVTEIKGEQLVALKQSYDEHRKESEVLQQNKQEVEVRLREVTLSFQEHINEIKIKHSEELSDLRLKFEHNLEELDHKYDKRLRLQRSDLDLQRKVELHELEERKNKQISELMTNHEKSFTDLKSYYKDITLSNLTLIKSLKTQVEELRQKEERMEKMMAVLRTENKKLTEPLSEARENALGLQKQLSNYERDKTALQNAKLQVKVLNKKIEELKWEREVIEQRFEKVQNERDEIYQKFVAAISEVQQKASLKNLILEKKLDSLTQSLQMKDLQLNEVLLNPANINILYKKGQDINNIDENSAAVKNLQTEVAEASKAYNSLLQDRGIKDAVYKPGFLPDGV